MRLDWELAKRGYRRYAAYPAATWAGILTNSVFGFIQAYVLLAMYETRDDIGGYDAADALTYVWLAQAMIAAVNVFGWSEFAERIRSGDVATDLIRPVHPLRAGLAFDYGRALYHTLFRGLPPMVVGAIVFDLTAPSDPRGLGRLPRQRRARDHRRLRVPLPLQPRGVLAARLQGRHAHLDRGARVLLGALHPDPLLPRHGSQTLAYMTPFPSMVQLPIDVFVGYTTGAELVATLAMQLGWAAVLLSACYAAFLRGTRKLVVQGG